MTLRFQIREDGFPCGAPIPTNFDSLNFAFLKALADIVGSESAQLGSFFDRDQPMELILETRDLEDLLGDIVRPTFVAL